MPRITMRQAISDALREEMYRDDRVFIMGEEVGEYDGAYKVSKGLLDEFGGLLGIPGGDDDRQAVRPGRPERRLDVALLGLGDRGRPAHAGGERNQNKDEKMSS